MGNGSMTKGMAKEFGLTVNKNMMENIKTANNMAKELGHQQMAKNIKDSGKSIKGVVLAFGLKDCIDMKAIGRIACIMGKAI